MKWGLNKVCCRSSSNVSENLAKTKTRILPTQNIMLMFTILLRHSVVLRPPSRYNHWAYLLVFNYLTGQFSSAKAPFAVTSLWKEVRQERMGFSNWKWIMLKSLCFPFVLLRIKIFDQWKYYSLWFRHWTWKVEEKISVELKGLNYFIWSVKMIWKIFVFR